MRDSSRDSGVVSGLHQQLTPPTQVPFAMALRLIGLGWTVPDLKTLSRRQKTLAVNIAKTGCKSA